MLIKAFLFLASSTAIWFYGYAIHSARDLFSEGGPLEASSGVPPSEDALAVTLLKPVSGTEPDLYENLASFCRQDYPAYQIIFGVPSEQDSSLEIIRRLIRDFPQKDIHLTVCSEAQGTNPKVRSLIRMEAQAKHPILLVSDSDIRVGPDFLKQIVRPFADPLVGAVTCMGRSRTNGLPSVLEALRISTEFYAGVLVARKLEGVKFGLGSAIALRRSVLEKIGGFTAISNYLADDFQLGSLVAKTGDQVVLSNYVVEHSFAHISFGDVIRRQIRWFRGIRVSRPWSYGGLVFSQGIPMSLLFLIATSGAAIGWGVLAVTWISRLVMASWVGGRCLKDPSAKKFLWLVPLQDLISFSVWCACFFGDTIDWRGERFRLTKAGTLIPHQAVSG